MIDWLQNGTFFSVQDKEHSLARASKFSDESDRKQPDDKTSASGTSRTDHGSKEYNKSDNKIYPDLESLSSSHQNDDHRLTRAAAKQRQSSQSKWTTLKQFEICSV